LSLIVPFSVERDADKQRGSELKKGNVLKLFLVLCVAVTFSGLLYRAFTLILPTFMEIKLTVDFEGLYTALMEAGETGVFSDEQGTLFAAIIAGCAYLIGMAGQWIGGRMADKYDLKKVYTLFVLLALPFILLLRFGSGYALIAFAGMFAFFTLGLQPVENSVFAMLTPPRWRSVAYGLKFTLAFGVGSLSVFLVNRVQNRRDIDAVVLLIAGYLVAMILSVFLLDILGRNQALRHTGAVAEVKQRNR
jgi:MFS family permease